jgi:hypothetical protein
MGDKDRQREVIDSTKRIALLLGIVAVVVCVVCVVGVVIGFVVAQNRHMAYERSLPRSGNLELKQFHLVHGKVTGVVQNDTKRVSLHLKARFALDDAKGNCVGSASAYIQRLEPGQKWSFVAPVKNVDAKGVDHCDLQDRTSIYSIPAFGLASGPTRRQRH